MPIRGQQATPSAVTIPLVYHGGAVMHGVTVHTIYWAPSGYAFDGAPPGDRGDYASVINGFLTDVASAIPARCANVFSLLGPVPGSDRVGAATTCASTRRPSRFADTAPYPRAARLRLAGRRRGCVTDAAPAERRSPA